MGTIPDYIEFLLDPSVYPHEAGEVELVQTHISYVTLAGNYVYKWKKPVNFGFVDFSTLERRRRFCEEELRLNRRLCPEIYLGVTWLSREGDAFSLAGAGEVVEYAVKMARMPEERMMNRVLRAGGVDKEHLERIVDQLVPFYRQAEGGERVRLNGRAEAVARNIFDNFAQTERFVGGEVLSGQRFARIRSYAERFLKLEERFAERIAAGCIRDCHGDLYSGNICLADRVHIFDCIEFNEKLRFIDYAADVAFLAMDLDFHGLPGLGTYFTDRFAARMDDREMLTMLNFYKCYRAYVRGKVGLLTAADPTIDGETARAALDAAAHYFQLAETYAERQE